MFLKIRRWFRGRSEPVRPSWQATRRGSSVVYEGCFIVHEESGRVVLQIPGRVVEWPTLPTDVYIWDPPGALRNHRHGGCFQLLDPTSLWFKLHWERPGVDFDTSRDYVEEVLSQAVLG